MHRSRNLLPLASPILLLVLVGCAGHDGGSSRDVRSGDVDASLDDDGVDCPVGLVKGENGVCAPYIPACEAWERPTLDGECVVVGPRACPRGWAPDVDVDCDPGDLLPCPAGLIPTEDEVACIPRLDMHCAEDEIPSPGGGCQDVGPEWGRDGEPTYDDCGSDLLALPGGGCVSVGSRACPRLWEPGAEVDCEAGDVLPCPAGWSEAGDGSHCEPVYELDCGPGALPLLGGGCVPAVTPAEACPAGPFPAAPPGIVDSEYVLGSSDCIQGCGAPGSPHASIQAAVDAVSDGGHVLVGTGVYPEGVIIEKPVTLIGLCPAGVVLTGSVILPGAMNQEVGLGIVGATGVEVSGITLVTPALAGIAVQDAQEFTIADVEVTGTNGPAVLVEEASQGALNGLWLHDTEEARWNPAFSSGLYVRAASVVTVAGTLVEATRYAGILATGAGTDLVFEDGTIRSTHVDEETNMAAGVLCDSSATMTLQRVVLEGNRALGVGAQFSAQVELTESVIRDTLSLVDGTFGSGAQATNTARLVIANSAFLRNRWALVSAHGEGTEIIARSSVLRETEISSSGGRGHGAVATSGGRLVLSGCLVEQSIGLGIGATDAGTEVELEGCLVRDTSAAPGGGGSGLGLQLDQGARARISHSVLQENTTAAAYVTDADTQLDLEMSVIRNTLGTDTSAGKVGLRVHGGGAAVVSHCLFDDNVRGGVWASEPETMVTANAIVIRGADPGVEESYGRGVQVTGGAQASLSRSVIEENIQLGMSVGGAGTQVLLEHSAVRGTRQDASHHYGHGIQVKEGALLSAMDSLVEGNAQVGISVNHADTVLSLERSIIRGNVPGENGLGGYGIQVIGQSRAEVEDSLIDQNMEIGVIAVGAGTELTLLRTTLRDTILTDQNIGHGLQVSEGASVLAEDCVVEGTSSGGIVAGDPGTQVQVIRSVLRGVLLDAGGTVGHGLTVSNEAAVHLIDALVEGNDSAGIVVHGAGSDVLGEGVTVRGHLHDTGAETAGITTIDGGRMTCSGCLVGENAGYGAISLGPDSELALLGSIVRNTQAMEVGDFGVGVVADAKGRILLRSSLVSGNQTGGVLINQPDSIGSVERCSVIDNLEGPLQFMGPGGPVEIAAGDGIAVFLGSLDVSYSLVARNNRAGIVFSRATGNVSGSVVTRNSSFGLVLDRCEAWVDYDEADNVILGNATDMAPGDARDVTRFPSGLVPPVLPDMDTLLP